jgi:DNA-binding NarL/FixJ family response regulator
MRRQDADRRSTTARVIVADDHPLLRSALADLLRRCSGYNVIGEAAHGQEALELCRRLRPDLVLMDVVMPVMDGVEATRKIKRELPRTVVLIITAFTDASYLEEALEAGAAGYVLKTAYPERIVDAVRRALHGEAPLNQEVAKELILNLMGRQHAEREGPRNLDPAGPPTRRSTPASGIGLSPREVEVLRLVARGYTNQQVAKELLISTSTAKKHVQLILAKLGTSDRTQAVVRAIEWGMLPKH